VETILHAFDGGYETEFPSLTGWLEQSGSFQMPIWREPSSKLRPAEHKFEPTPKRADLKGALPNLRALSLGRRANSGKEEAIDRYSRHAGLYEAHRRDVPGYLKLSISNPGLERRTH